MRFRRRRKRPAADTRMQQRDKMADKRATMEAIFALTATVKEMGEEDEKNEVVKRKREKESEVALFS